MKHFYSTEKFIQYAQQQIFCNRDLIRVLEITAEILPRFDGKQINKRIQTAVNTRLDETFKNAMMSFGNGYTSGRWVDFWARDNDSYRVGEYSCDYVEYETHIELHYTGSASGVLDAAGTVNEINGRIKYLTEINDTLNYEIKNIDTIKAAYESIKSEMDKFNRSRSYLIRELYNFQ